MLFAQTFMLHLLWLVIPLALFFLWSIRNRRQLMERFIQPSLIKDVALGLNEVRIVWKNILLTLVFVFSILALARPQWGFEWREVKKQGVDILVVVDTSKSMLTQDVKPNRLERTKLAIHDVLRKLKGDRIGLIAFAGDAFLVCPLTVDYNGFLLSLNDLSTSTMPRGGTDIGAAITEAMKAYDKTPNAYKAIVIMTDGDNLEGDPLAVAKKAKEKGVRVYTIGIGTPDGELIQITQENGQKEFLKDNSGNYVKSRLNEKLLQEIALTTGGAYVRASGAEFGLETLYDREISKLEKHEFESKMDKRYFERFQIPLTLAVILLFCETCLPRRKKQN